MYAKIRSGSFVFATLLVTGIAAAGPAEKYAEKWAEREKRAITPAMRVALAQEILEDIRPTSRSTVRKVDPIPSMSAAQKEDLVYMCGKLYELSAKQRESYGIAAAALDMIQRADIKKRADCLTKLAQLYDAEYSRDPNGKVGMAKGLADTLMQLGAEKWVLLLDRENLTPEEFGKEALEIQKIYSRAGSVLRPAMSSIRGALAAGNAPPSTRVELGPGGARVVTTSAPTLDASKRAAFQTFVAEGQAIENELAALTRQLEEPLKKSQAVVAAKNRSTQMQARLKTNPADKFAADTLVRLAINELDDDALLAEHRAKSSPATQAVVALLEKPVGDLGAADALSVAKWLDKANDNPDSPMYRDMLVRVRTYAKRYLEANPADPAEARTTQLLVTRLETNLAKVNIDTAAADAIAAKYTEELTARAEAEKAAIARAAEEKAEAERKAAQAKAEAERAAAIAAANANKPPEPVKISTPPVAVNTTPTRTARSTSSWDGVKRSLASSTPERSSTSDSASSRKNIFDFD